MKLKGKTGLLELPVFGHMCGVFWGSRRRLEEGSRSYIIESQCVEFVILDCLKLVWFKQEVRASQGHEMTMQAWFHERLLIAMLVRVLN